MKRYIRAAIKTIDDESAEIKEQIASDPNTRPDVLVRLAGDTYYSHPLVAALLKNPNLPPEALTKMIYCCGDDSWAIGEILKHPNVTEGMEYTVAQSGNVHVRKEIFESGTDVPVEILELLWDDDSTDIRVYVAQNPNTPAKILAKMAGDPSTLVRFWVSHNPNTPEDVAESLAGAADQLTENKFDDRMGVIARDPNAPADFLERIANTSQDYMTLRFVASNPNTPENTLRNMARAGHSYGTSLASNPSTPADLLDELSKDRDKYQRMLIAKNPSTSAATLKRLSKSADWRTRDAVAGNPNTPYAVLQRLMTTAIDEQDDDLQYIISNNPSYTNH